MNAPQELIAELYADGESVLLARSAPRESAATDGTFVLEWRLIRVGWRGAAALYAIADRETARKVLPSAQLTVILYRRIDMVPVQAVEQDMTADWWLWQIAPTPWAAVWNHDDAFFAAESLDGLHAFAVAQRHYERALLADLEIARRPLHREHHERFMAALAEQSPALRRKYERGQVQVHDPQVKAIYEQHAAAYIEALQEQERGARDIETQLAALRAGRGAPDPGTPVEQPIERAA
ncbi:hypothetical protein SE17_05690 [Kouleothrix aurantiaca]|uniref:Uncharacterized protein n=1 Tax=Kouleothrix aurantiaca TaxID=186479 RepID=A0A0P9FBP7_9CHLR|nr:hypothetical protein SE17_05690 [Kouleothrix aurantiaca]